jgi:hypothetical protein
MSIRRLAWPALFTTLLSGWAACTLDFDQFEGGSRLDPTTSSTTTSSAGGSGGSTTLTTTGPGGAGGTTSNGGTGGVTSAGGMGGGTTSTGGMGGMAPTLSVPCETTPCDVSGNGICCLPTMGGAQCITTGSCTGQRYPVTCNEPADCPGQVCCGDFSINNYTLLECRSTCIGLGEVIICSSNNDCGGGDTCQNSQFLPSGYQVCRQ